MNYKLVTYENTHSVIGIDGERKIYIPLDPANTDYQAYLEWVAEGNTAEEWQPEEAQ